jgi:hypothetical protein
MEVLSIFPISKMGCNTHGAFYLSALFCGRTINLKMEIEVTGVAKGPL